MNKINQIENLNGMKKKSSKLPKIIGIKESISAAIEREDEDFEKQISKD